MKHYHKTVIDEFETTTDTSACPACQQQRYDEAVKKSLDLLDKERHAIPLECDLCGVVIGKVYENDLNGSNFFCNNH